MKKLFLDIETLPADTEDPAILESLKLLYEKRNSKMEEEAKISFEEFVDKTSFDGSFGRVACIAVGKDNEEVVCHSSDESGTWDEKRLLEWFWKVAEQSDLFVGHNIFDFDTRFICQRSVVLGARPTKDFNFGRYRSNPIFDTMQEWTKWGWAGKLTLEHLALALGIPTPKVGIDGSQVAEFYKQGKIKEICEYCKRDVETTREIYKRMTFSS